MEDETKYISLGPPSPQIPLPEPVKWTDHHDDISWHSFTSRQHFSTKDGTDGEGDKSVVVEMRGEEQSRCRYSDENQHFSRKVMKQHRNSNDDATVWSNQSDLNSNAFYWESSPRIVTHDLMAAYRLFLLRYLLDLILLFIFFGFVSFPVLLLRGEHLAHK